jgi:CHAT domain-containing protein/tetratricopeptide (TPR) repeat protein
MPKTYAQQLDLTCPECSSRCTAEAYLIVDITERPDLLERIRSRTLHDISCPNCDYIGQVDMPLLIFRPDDEPHILFSPAQETSQEENQQQARELIEQLMGSLGSTWQDNWLKDGLQGVQRQVLPAALSDDPQAAMHELAEKQARELERLKIEDPEQYLQVMLNAWLDAQDLAQKRQILEEAPELLSEQAEELLTDLLEKAQGNKDKNAEQFYQEHLDLLAACRSDGVAVVFEQLTSRGSNRQAPPEGLQGILEEINRPARQSDMPRRIELCQQALDMVPRDTQPKLWGALQIMLAISLAQTPLGKRAENLEQAIRHYRQALEVYTRHAFPEDWAMTQNNLANAYAERIRGERAENIEQAIHHYRQALEVYTRQAFPEDWAQTTNNLANAYAERIHEERADNLEQAIHHYLQALEVRTRQAYPQDWADTQNNLAVAYKVRIRGERGENLEQAIHHFQQALEVRTWQANPERWAETQNSLAAAYSDRIRGERAENLEQAIHHFQQALVVHTRQAFPQYWAGTQNNLANAYWDRIRGERAENLEQAIHHYRQALEVRTRQAFPQDWAMTQNNLANAYRDRIRGERAENLEQAIHHFQQALEVLTRQALPQDWAQMMNNLALAYADRIRGERAENLEQAIQHYQQALEVKTRQADPEHWAQTMNNLANAYADRIRGDRAENLEQAIHHYQQAQEVYTRQAFPQYWAMTQNNLALAYKDRIRGERGENLEQVIRHFQQALEVYTRQAFPEDCRQTARTLGHLAFEEQRWELARDAYQTAFAAQEVLMQASFTRSGKQAQLGEAQSLPRRAAYVHLQLGNLEQAVEVLEQGRAQLLREVLERQRQDLEQLPVLGFERLYKEYMQAMEEYDALQSMGASESIRPVDWISQVERALEKVQAATAAIREEVGKEHLQYRHFLQALPFDEIQKQALENPLVYLCATSAGGLGLIVTRQGVQALELAELNQTALQEQLWRPSDKELERINAHIQQGSITDADIQAAKGGYLSMYRLWGMMPFLENTSDELKLKLHKAWFETLDETTGWLWDVMMGELVNELKPHGDTVTLIPTGILALLPLHAAWTEDNDKTTGRLYALDELCFSYAPSAHALWQASLAVERPADTLMAVDNPDGTLIFSEDEVQAILDEFKHSDPVHLQNEKATLETVTREMQRAHVLHFSTHGIAGWENAEDARLTLADGYLTLPDIFKLELDNTRLAVLSACETGVPSLELIDEMIGLPAGMMQAGVPGVVGSLWSVSDMSTSMLMARFYELWRKDGLPPREALRRSQIWLRDSTTTEKKALFDRFMERQVTRMSADTAQAFYQHIGWDDPDASVFASPFFWAAFTYTGI